MKIKLLLPAVMIAYAMSVMITPMIAFTQAAEPYKVEFYYKVKWGYLDEFMTLYKKNHYPILKELRKRGEILGMEAAYPLNHAPESSRWDFRYTIIFKNFEASRNKPLSDAIALQLYPDQAVFRMEEQRRFEILIEHTDVPVREEDPGEW
ncbi:MAG TPA: hypothetical protein VI583_04450 [Cyclobacteriaceae bacterium]|nr:hypothetical protein [Cyclobacteriaceae bacterium]